MKKLFLALIFAGFSFVAYLYIYLGFSRKVDIELAKRGPHYLLFQEHLGAYHQIGPLIHAAEQWASINNVHCPRTFGEFIDDPQAIDQDRLRSRAGCVLLTPLNTLPTEFKFEERPEQLFVVARFSGSPSVGPFTVYPKVRDFMDQNRLKAAGPVIEIYTVDGSDVTTEFLFPIEN